MPAFITTILLAAFTALILVPPQYLPSYRRGGWGRHYRGSR